MGDKPDGAVFGRAVPIADAVVASPEEDADATRSELREQAAHIHRVFPRAEILVRSVRGADRLWDFWLPEDVSEPGDVPVVCAKRPFAGAVEDERGRIRHGPSVLGVEVRLCVGVARVVPPTVDLYDGEGRVRRVGAVFEHERRQVRGARIIP